MTFFVFFGGEHRKKAKKIPVSRDFAVFAARSHGQHRRCGHAVGHPLVHGAAFGAVAVYPLGMGRPDGPSRRAPPGVHVREGPQFRNVPVQYREKRHRVVPRAHSHAFAPAFPRRFGRREGRGRLRGDTLAPEQRRGVFPAGAGASATRHLLAGAPVHLVAAHAVPVCGGGAVCRLDAAQAPCARAPGRIAPVRAVEL